MVESRFYHLHPSFPFNHFLWCLGSFKFSCFKIVVTSISCMEMHSPTTIWTIGYSQAVPECLQPAVSTSPSSSGSLPRRWFGRSSSPLRALWLQSKVAKCSRRSRVTSRIRTLPASFLSPGLCPRERGAREHVSKNGPPLPNTMRVIEERQRAGEAATLQQPLGHSQRHAQGSFVCIRTAVRTDHYVGNRSCGRPDEVELHPTWQTGSRWGFCFCCNRVGLFGLHPCCWLQLNN